ncbi:hypothetical protein JCM15519_21740 [Fundidesulfovibrio butyratiphilus]
MNTGNTSGQEVADGSRRSSFLSARLPGALLGLALLAVMAVTLLPTQAAHAQTTAPGDLNRCADLDRREQALKSLEDQMNARMAQLKQLEATLTSMLNEAKSIKDARLAHLIDVYSNMKPRQAGAALEALDVPTAVKILAGMKGRQAGDILSTVSSKKAASLSNALTRLQMGPDLPAKP